jgi:hypothetical protein
MEQSIVGNVLSSWAILPPMLGDFSTRYTLIPRLATSKAACIPAMPPPITRTALFPMPIPWLFHNKYYLKKMPLRLIKEYPKETNKIDGLVLRQNTIRRHTSSHEKQ